MDGKSGPTQVTWEAVVIRADGTRENLGVISYWHKNPLRRMAWNIKRAMRRGA
jgi:hypothetical protein